MAGAITLDPFSLSGLTAETKLLMLGEEGPFRELLRRARSLHIEHVSPPALRGGEISRPSTGSGPAGEAALLARFRRWFFARKPDAGFVLADFPATLLQALVFDEWLDARGEMIDAVLIGRGAPAPVAGHYEALGLAAEAVPG